MFIDTHRNIVHKGMGAQCKNSLTDNVFIDIY